MRLLVDMLVNVNGIYYVHVSEQAVELDERGIALTKYMHAFFFFFFLIFINDIGHSIESIIKLFADDTSMSLGLANPDSRAEILMCYLVKISDWAKL